MVCEDAVDLLGHGGDEAAESRFDMGGGDGELRGREGAGEGGVRVAEDHDGIGLAFEDGGLGALECPGGHGRVREGAYLEMDIGFGEGQLGEEAGRHASIVVLTSVKDSDVVAAAAGLRKEGGELDELGPCADNGEEPHKPSRQLLGRCSQQLVGLGGLVALCLTACGGGAENREAATPTSAPTSAAGMCSGPAGLPTYPELVAAALQRYRSGGIDYVPNLVGYEPGGNYLNWSATLRYSESEFIRVRPDGVPEVFYKDGFYLNPVTVAQHTLAEHGRYLAGEVPVEAFLHPAELLLGMQDEDGALRNAFRWEYYRNGEVYEPGWVSALAQAQAMSAWARAYLATGDERYFQAGERALAFMLKPLEAGGLAGDLGDLDPNLAAYPTWEEYVTEPLNYTLNGFMFVLLGLHDWQAIEGSSSTAGEAWAEGVETLKVVLPYHDSGGFSAYDLGHLTMGGEPSLQAEYHAIHIYLLHALVSITGDATLECVLERWQSYVGG